ncbi:hypothetical protein CHI12_16200 [Terribacillus saccharophilus]|uniref:DUF2953 domain-containing protein n=1 Tax=Terribacillus saccharophilus TaxID=361277 RepID=A0A268H9D9_9BACI|nr:DUF2953 domain-containing protein [Terribacillus saccharophilus]PAE06496.1 hypothetical protein CHI12_16200 [Terribacillus saccharophilus]
MWIVISFGLGVLLLVAVALVARVTVHICYDQKKWNIRIRVFGICVHKRQFKQQSSIEHTSADDIKQQLSDLFTDLQRMWNSFPYLLQITKSAEMQQFRWHTTIGMSDAAAVGTMVGLVWTIKGIANQIIRSNFQIRQPFDIQVQPVFQTSFFDTSFQCIVSIRTGKAMQAIISNARGR